MQYLVTIGGFVSKRHALNVSKVLAELWPELTVQARAVQPRKRRKSKRLWKKIV